MALNPENPTIVLCVKGLALENRHRFEDAMALYGEAWGKATTDLERCIAAHYVARHQNSPQDTLRWNLEALAHADAINVETVREFYPSLYLNLGRSYEEAGDLEMACTFYGKAGERLDDVPAGPYREVVCDGIRRGRERVCKS